MVCRNLIIEPKTLGAVAHKPCGSLIRDIGKLSTYHLPAVFLIIFFR